MNLKIIANGAISLVLKRYAGPFWLRRKQLAETQWLDEQRLCDLQLKLLKRLIAHCYATVPYYRQLMNERGIRIEDINSLGDIKLFPILTKKEVLQAGRALVSSRYPRWMLRTGYTGGTTGTPLALPRNLFSVENEHAFVRRQWDWAGIGLRDRCAYLTGRLIAKPDQTDNLYGYDPVMKELILSTYHLSPERALSYAQVIKEYKVKAIIGYPSAVHLLARTCLDAGIEIKLTSALTSSETLTESMRQTIAKAFDCNVFDFYGSAERVCYIHTCERDHYHVIPEYGLTEFIPLTESDNSTCRVISTGFWSTAMPLIRYDTGDIVTGSNETCSCGRVFPVIKSIVGRQGDVIKTPSGREFGAAILTHLLYGINNILESQIIQDSICHITIQYVPGKLFSKKDFEAFRNLLQKHLLSELKFDFKQVSAVRRTNNGKIKPVVSLISEKDYV